MSWVSARSVNAVSAARTVHQILNGVVLGGAVGNPLVGYIADHFNLTAAFTVIAAFYLIHGLLIKGLGGLHLARRNVATAGPSR